jgi:hypothetical protein
MEVEILKEALDEANDPTDPKTKPLPQVPLLITESEEEFQEIRDGVYKEIRSRTMATPLE